MNKYDLISLISLLVLVIALPVYMVVESDRMARNQALLQEQFVEKGAVTYVENCVSCHGPSGEGVGAMPGLNTLDSAKPDELYQTIAHSPHGSPMSIWHVEEQGLLNGYQVEGLVTLIMAADWSQVELLASERGFNVPTPAAPASEMAKLELREGNPHECYNCHEEPDIHAGQFGLNCARCHTLQAWKPAMLNRHTFFLDHGDEGQVACQTCHTYTYSDYTCYGCHEHTREEMQQVHAQEGIPEVEASVRFPYPWEKIGLRVGCADCHPTGQSGEAGRLREQQAQPTTDPEVLRVEIEELTPGREVVSP